MSERKVVAWEREVANTRSIRHWRAAAETPTLLAGSQSLSSFGELRQFAAHAVAEKKVASTRSQNFYTHTRESELEKSCDARRRTNKLIWPDTTLLMRGLIS